MGDPWVTANAAADGKRFANGKWVKEDLSKFSIIFYESMSGIAEAVMLDSTKQNAEGKGVGGKAQFVLNKGTGAEALKVAANTIVDYSSVQSFVTEVAWKSQTLGLPIVWTTHVKRGTDEDNSQVLGPVVAGKALTTVVPRWFTYTFRLDAIPQAQGRPRHVLYVEEHTDTGLKGFGNARIPLSAAAQSTTSPFKSVIEPASVVEAMKQIRQAQDAVEAEIRARRKK